MRRILWVLAVILSAVLSSNAQTTTTLYFPQVADGQSAGGGLWQTFFVVTNPAAVGSAAVSGTIVLKQGNGSPFAPTFSDVNGNSLGTKSMLPFSLAGGQTFIAATSGIPPLTTGFATLTANGVVTGAAIYQEYICSPNANLQTGQGCNEAGEALVPPQTPLKGQSLVVGKLSNTGFALANPNTTSATVTLQILNLNGGSGAAPVSFTLGPGNQIAEFANQVFTNASDPFYGTLQITTSASTPLVATPLYFNGNGPFFTGVVVPLP